MRPLSKQGLLSSQRQPTPRPRMLVHKSHRMERLVDVLADVIAQPGASALEPETIIIQSKGMERWLSNELSKKLGVFANTRFPFPRAFIDEVFDIVVPTPKDQQADYRREVMAFGILSLLEPLLADPAFSPLQGYLDDDASGLKRFQLAERIAYVFDQYLVYRPGLLLRWEQSGGSDWQPRLWRALRERLGPNHFAVLAARFFKEWSPLLLPRGSLPRRVFLFGISSLPPIYLKILNLVSERIETHLFLLSPSPEYFAQVRSLRQVVRSGANKASLDFDDSELELIQGNPLLASLGKTGQHFQFCLERDTRYRESNDDLFVQKPGGTLLELLQQDIVQMQDSSLPGSQKHVVDSRDRSISILSCHSPVREVEVLKDQLLGLFDDDPTLEPSDVLVMSPNIDAYAPIIDAVFGVDSKDPHYIPYRIADRTERNSNLCAKSLLALLDVLPSRMTASEVLDLLQLAPIRRRFDIDANELNQLQSHIHEAGIRWGIDAEHRVAWQQPRHAKNTWRFGLDRLLLGVALPPAQDSLFMDTVPVDDVEGDSAVLLGKLAEFAGTLFWAAENVRETRPVSAWITFLRQLCSRLISPDDTEIWQQRVVLDALAEIERVAQRAQFSDAIALLPLVDQLTRLFESERVSHQFLAGGVTFCAMLPMRSIPFRVVVLLGMSDGEFPRVEQALSFDLIQKNPEAGDRSAKEEDRYLFLEALLSARHRLLLSYVGRGVQDNAELPPAPVVSELLDYVQGGFQRQHGVLKLVTEHPLQPFSPRYFTGENTDALFSFAAAEATAAKAMTQRRCAPPFANESLPDANLGEQINLDDLIRFLQNPARGFLQNRLGVFLGDDPALVEDREPLELGPLERYELGATLLDQMLDASAVSPQQVIEKTGVLPDGTPGSIAYHDVYREVRQIAERAARFRAGEPDEPLPLRIAFDGFTLSGELRHLYPEAQLYWQYARVKPRNELALWLRHLALCATSNQTGQRLSVLLGRRLEESRPETAVCIFEPVPHTQAREFLSEIIKLFSIGHRFPLPLFPSASKTYVSELRRGRDKGKLDEAKALTKARENFAPSFGASLSESADPYVVRVFSGLDPFEERSGDTSTANAARTLSFQQVSRLVFEPLLGFMQGGDVR